MSISKICETRLCRNTRFVVKFTLVMMACLLVIWQLVPPQHVTLLFGKEDRERIKERVSELESAIQKLWCKNHDVLYNGGFCVSSDNLVSGGNNVFDPKLCRYIEILVKNGSIGDFGAGLGFYGMCLLRMKETTFNVAQTEKIKYMDNYNKVMGSLIHTHKVVHSWHGYDGASNIGPLSGGFILQVDLSKQNLWLGRRWDWVMSVEVGEHIPVEGEAAFLDNIVRHACKGVLLTWAVEGQGGHHHVNTRNNDYIKERMRERGLINDLVFENKMRSNLDVPWLRNTVMLFRFPDPTDCLES